MTQQTAEQTTPSGATVSQPDPGQETPPGNGSPPEPSTTEMLFPDFIDEQGQLHGEQVRPEVAPRLNRDFFEQIPPQSKEPGGEGTPAQPTPPLTPGAPAPTQTPQQDATQYLSLEDLKGKLVKTKVDGVEMGIPAETLIKNHQLESHLQARIREVNEREKRLNKIQEDLLQRNAPPAQPGEPGPSSDSGAETNPEVKALRDEINVLKQQLVGVNEIARKARYQEGIAKLAEQAKTDFGRTDFMDFVPKIEAEIRSQLVDPANPTKEEVARFDNATYYLYAYSRMIAKNQGTPPVPPPPPQGVRNPPSPTPAPETRRPANPNVDIEPAGGSPPRATLDKISDWQRRYQAAHTKAVKTGRDEDWKEVLRIKDEPQTF